MDAEAYRADSRERWEAAAPGWAREREAFQRDAIAVSQWLLDAAHLQPGHTVLELAAGPADTGLMAAELVAPGGKAIITDNAEAMIQAAKARAEEVGATNVEIRPMEAEWIDLPTASVDAVLCRWGYMLLADPEAALRETRRVLKPGGTVALAVWTGPEDNPWSSVPNQELVRMGAAEPPDPAAPGQFVWRDPAVIAEALEEAGFVLAEIDQVDFTFRYPSLDDWWDVALDLSPGMYDAVATLTPAQRDDLRDAIDARLAEYVAGDGSVALPARTHVAAASA